MRPERRTYRSLTRLAVVLDMARVRNTEVSCPNLKLQKPATTDRGAWHGLRHVCKFEKLIFFGISCGLHLSLKPIHHSLYPLTTLKKSNFLSLSLTNLIFFTTILCHKPTTSIKPTIKASIFTILSTPNQQLPSGNLHHFSSSIIIPVSVSPNFIFEIILLFVQVRKCPRRGLFRVSNKWLRLQGHGRGVVVHQTRITLYSIIRNKSDDTPFIESVSWLPQGTCVNKPSMI